MNSLERGGLFVDLDGTLADSINLMGRVFQRFLDLKGIGARAADFASMRGRPLGDLAEFFRERHGLDCTEKSLINDFYDLADQVYVDETKPLPGAGLLLEAAARRGRAVALVTSARGTVAQAFLRRHGFDGLVRAVVAAEHVERSKPDPQPYLLAMSILDVGPTGSLAVEDSAVGARSAMAAGLATWIIDHDGRSDAVDLPGVRGVAGSLEQIIPFL